MAKAFPGRAGQAFGRSIWTLGLSLLLAAGMVTEEAEGFTNSQFVARFENGALIGLKPAAGPMDAEYIQAGRRLGDVFIRYRRPTEDWQTASTASLTNLETVSLNTDSNRAGGRYGVQDPRGDALTVETRFEASGKVLLWTITIQNTASNSIEIGDLALPLPINRSLGENRGAILKHSFISGHGSFMYWMRSDGLGSLLTLVPTGDTSLEYWEGSRELGYRVFVHSMVAGAEAAQRGTKWRQPHTSLTLAPRGRPGDARSYSFKLYWAADYEAIRQLLVDEGGVDVQVIPGMTVPADLSAQFALRTKQEIKSVEAEFPGSTKVTFVGEQGDYRRYEVKFSKLGENRLTVRYGANRHMFLEFFCTEPIETLIRKRGAFLARSQHRDPEKWYDGLITDWNMESRKLISPDDYAPIPRSRVYAVTCDDPGLGKPAFLAAKNAEFPVQSEVEALDYYIQHFVWGGLQRTTNETYAYGIYGIPDWKRNRESEDPGRNGKLHLWRIYDYPHVVAMYFGMYRVAKQHPEIRTALPAKQYLERAYGTANAMFTVPHEIWTNWSPYGTGFYNEIVLVDLIDELAAAGKAVEADTLRGFWERKVRNFVNRRQDLFRSEYAFDTTGFESTHALAKYATTHPDQAGSTNLGVSLADARRFLEKQMAANVFCRGSLEPAYYCLGSDYRGAGGNAYTLTYMSQMGGWGVLDYALNFATNDSPYLRLGYASYLSAWALVNSGTPDSNYGFWFPGKMNDGGAGGGFEPAAFGTNWLGQPHHRGSWYFSCEIDLGFCGALRTAATVLADDPIFGRVCFGGDWTRTPKGIEVLPKDGLRRRFFARLNGRRLSLVLDGDRFVASEPITMREDLSEFACLLESDNRADHETRARLAVPAGMYKLQSRDGRVSIITVKDQREAAVLLPMSGGKGSLRLTRQ